MKQQFHERYYEFKIGGNLYGIYYNDKRRNIKDIG